MRSVAGALTLLLVVFPAALLASATDFIVGDDSGWTVDVDYQAWASGKQFFVGDTLVFKYAAGHHTVVKVNGSGFDKCMATPNNGTLTSGSDRIRLATPGNKWYICGVADHCSSFGQKLKITVLSPSPATSPAPSSPSTPLSPIPQPWGPMPMPPMPASWAAPADEE